MGTPARGHRLSYDLASWEVEVARMMDEHHLIAWHADADERETFAEAMVRYFRSRPETDTVEIRGRLVHDLESFCVELERGLDTGQRIERSIDDEGGITDAIQDRDPPGRRPPKWRYYVWRDADHLLGIDRELFGRLVDAIAGVAVEMEYVNDDLLLIHRGLFIGGPALDGYAEDERGQFRSWWSEGEDEVPFWLSVTGIERPPFRRLRIGDRLT